MLYSKGARKQKHLNKKIFLKIKQIRVSICFFYYNNYKKGVKFWYQKQLIYILKAFLKKDY